MNRLKGLIGFAAVLILACVAIYVYTNNDKLAPFKEFRSDAGQFAVLMPGKPDVQNEATDMPFGKVNTITYMAGSRKIGCAVAYTDYPELLIKSTDTRKLFELAKDEAVKNGGGKLISETIIDFHGLPAMDVRIEIPGNIFTSPAFTTTRYILKSPRFYTLMFFAPADKGREQDISQFLNSFKIDGVK
jgi:hypothetical protein